MGVRKQVPTLHWVSTCFAYSHFAHLRPKSGVSPTLKKIIFGHQRLPSMPESRADSHTHFMKPWGSLFSRGLCGWKLRVGLLTHTHTCILWAITVTKTVSTLIIPHAKQHPLLAPECVEHSPGKYGKYEGMPWVWVKVWIIKIPFKN